MISTLESFLSQQIGEGVVKIFPDIQYQKICFLSFRKICSTKMKEGHRKQIQLTRGNRDPQDDRIEKSQE